MYQRARIHRHEVLASHYSWSESASGVIYITPRARLQWEFITFMALWFNWIRVYPNLTLYEFILKSAILGVA